MWRREVRVFFSQRQNRALWNFKVWLRPVERTNRAGIVSDLLVKLQDQRLARLYYTPNELRPFHSPRGEQYAVSLTR